MPEHPGLLRAILDDPEDDAARLVYADWLEEQGDGERAEFIRAQVRLASLKPYDDGYSELQHRSETLLARNRAEWIAGLPRSMRERESFRRGFLAYLWVGVLDFVRHGSAVIARHPLEHVCLSAGTHNLLGLFQAPHLAAVRGIGLSPPVFNESLVAQIAACPAARLKCLHLDRPVIEPRQLRPLLNAPLFDTVTDLSLRQSPPGGMLADALRSLRRHVPWRALDFLASGPGAPLVSFVAESPTTAGIEELRLDINHLRGSDIGPLLRSKNLGNLRKLWLTSNQLGAEGVHALLSAPNLPALEDLNVSHNPIGDAPDIFGGMRRSQFRRLHLCNLALTADPLRALARQSGLESVEHLDLSANPLGLGGMRALAESPCLGSLRSLSLSSTGMNAAAMEELSRAPWFPRLRVLDLSENPLAPEGFPFLLRQPVLPRLSQLYLGGKMIDAPLIEALAESPILSEVNHLRLQGARLGPAGVRALLRSPYLDRITSLDLTNTLEVTARDREMLRERFGPFVR